MNRAVENFLLFYSAEGLGAKFLKKFFGKVKTFDGDPEELIERFADAENLTATKKEELKRRILENRNFKTYLSFLKGVGAKVLPFFEREFPEELKKEDIPVLFVLGDFDLSNGFSIVGTRRASAEGKLKAFQFASALARANFTVVSGGAFGIDRSAHEGALASGGRTAVVLGEGLYHYLKREGRFAEEVLKQGGTLISQFPPFMKAARWSFPKRNLLIAYFGFYGLLVVEAPERSGALITVSHAERLRRPVFAYVGCTSHPNHKGTVALISEGKARLVVGPDQLLTRLGNDFRKTPSSVTSEVKSTADPERSILAHLSEGPKTFDQLLAVSGLPEGELLTVLTELELEGKILSEGGFYKKL